MPKALSKEQLRMHRNDYMRRYFSQCTVTQLMDEVNRIALDSREFDEDELYAAAAELQIKGGKEAIEFALEASQGKKRQRDISAYILGQIKLPTPALKKKALACLTDMALNDRAALVRSGALSALGHFDFGKKPQYAQELLDAISHAVQSPEFDLRFSAIFALMNIRHPETQALLLKLLRDKDKSIRDWAAFAVHCHGDESADIYTPAIRNALVKLLNDKDEMVRAEAIYALAQAKDLRVIPALKKALRNLDALDICIEAAGTLGRAELLPALERLQKKCNQYAKKNKMTKQETPDEDNDDPLFQAIAAIRMAQQHQENQPAA
jgi:HEAT repeat protein